MSATRLELNLMRPPRPFCPSAPQHRARKPAPELLNEYSRKVDFLKGLLEAEKLSSSMEKALANQFLAPGRTPTTAKERTPATKTVHLQTKARCTGQMRSELLGTVCSVLLC
uniref:Vesicle transport protein USE1 n=1 Tax=Cyanistes caeruleus TaxID=156563 RepID=A0A8C0ZKI2_CYACU